MSSAGLLFVAIVGIWIAIYFRDKSRRLRRAAFIRGYEWPSGLLDKLNEMHPALTSTDVAQVADGLRQFFIVHLMCGRKFVAMPSQSVDDLWHEFILNTREYAEFCKQAFGRFMHHTPAIVMESAGMRDGDGLRRVWWYACRDENIDPKKPARLPLLFALDGALQVPNGFRYALHCEALRRDGVTGIHCTSHLSGWYDAGTTSVPCGG